MEMDKKRRLVLLGGGGHCESVLDAAKRMNWFEEIVITDNHLKAGSELMGCRAVGGDEMLPRLFQYGFGMAFVSVGSIKSSRLRRELCRKAEEAGFDFPNIIDPSAAVLIIAISPILAPVFTTALFPIKIPLPTAP